MIQPATQSLLLTFLRECYANKISVEFLFGAADWVLTPNHEIALNLARLSVAFQKSISNAVPSYDSCNSNSGGGIPVTTGPATTGRATTGRATTGTATTGPATTGRPATSTTGPSGGTGTNGNEVVVLTRTPATTRRRGTFNVSVGYVAQGRRDIVVELLDSNNYNGFGWGQVTVPAGKGGAVISIDMRQVPVPEGNNYFLRAWSVDAGMGNIPGAYNSKYDQDTKPVIVTTALSYTDSC